MADQVAATPALAGSNKASFKLDVLSAKYESHGDPATVSNGSGDPGGVSYGTHQLSSRAGSVGPFIQFCVSTGYFGGPILQSAGTPGSAEFSAAWENIAAKDKSGFYDVQYKYAYEAYFLPGVASAAEAGVDLNKHTDALKAVIFSVAIQYGSGNCGQMFKEVAAKLGKPVESLNDPNDDRAIIQAVYEIRKVYDWIGNGVSDDVRAGLINRFDNEYQDALILLSGDGAAISKIMESNVLGGSSAGGKASDDGFRTKMVGKDTVNIAKLPIGKTFAEPIYPDLVTVSDKLPQWLLDQVDKKIPIDKMRIGDMLMYTVPTSVLQEACGRDLDTILGNTEDLAARQRVFDPKNYKKEIKKPNPGKPANNNDPFPTDLKIEELEVHKPSVKIHNITCHKHAESVAKAVLNISDRTEKRLAKLENNIATLMRYFSRLASRVHINCVYYGGQTPFEKYKCIRCLQDDRLSDGQMMSMDQCLNCTRYEPIIGQVYEIINDAGTNLAAILDDNQMAYMDMQDYMDFTKIENYAKEKTKASIDLAGITVRDTGKKDFKDVWPKGIEMDWKLVPVEEQKPHVNWRQSINDDGSSIKKLASFYNEEQNAGHALTSTPTRFGIMQKNAEAMNSNTNTALTSAIEKGKQYTAGVTDDMVNKLKGGLEKEIRSKTSGTDIDALIIASIMAVENSTDITSVIDRYTKAKTGLGGITNPAIIISAYKLDPLVIIGNAQKSPPLPRIDQVINPNDTGTGASASASDTPAAGATFNLNWDSRDTWMWTEFAEPMKLNSSADGLSVSEKDASDFFPCVCYLYVELSKLVKTSRYDGDQFAFPFFEDQLKGVWYVSPYGTRTLNGTTRKHCGVDLATGKEGEGMQIHACANGVVIADGAGGYEEINGVVIDHQNGWYTRYFHNSSVCVSVGQVVNKGDVISAVGDVGSGGAYHLHVEICQGGSASDNALDPVDFWPLLNGKLEDGGPALSDR